MMFDPLYFLFLAPGILLALWAQARISSAFHTAKQLQASCGLSGAQAAATIMQREGLNNVDVVAIDGFLSDHYDPTDKVLRLSPDVYQGHSIAALGVAAHEAGHAFQDAERYPLLVMRNALVPLANFGGNISWLLIIGGFILSMGSLVYIGIEAFALTVLFQVVNLPVEFDASARARAKLQDSGLLTLEEDREVAKVLNAAALTYVAATLTSILTLLYFLFRAGVLNSRN